jgi:4-hydroxybenzoate polyprenyltransferase
VGRPLSGRLRALVALAHPLPSAATVGVALAFMWLEARWHPPLRATLLVTAMLLFQQVAISVHNDYCDRALDAVAKPWRAIPSGRVAARTALAAAWFLAALSLALAALIDPWEVALSAVGLAAGFAYNGWLKRTWLSWLPFAIAFPLIPMFGAFALPGLQVPAWAPLGAYAAEHPWRWPFTSPTRCPTWPRTSVGVYAGWRTAWERGAPEPGVWRF